MSAEHSHTSSVNAPGRAYVIDITKRRPGRAASNQASQQGRWRRVDSACEELPEPAAPEIQQRMAERVEETFIEAGLSLTDETVASSYLVTLQIIQGLMQGAQAQGIVDPAQGRHLDAMLEGAKAAPGLIAG